MFSYRTVGKSIRGVRFSASECHHPVRALELMRTHASNMNRGILGHEITRLQVGHFRHRDAVCRKGGPLKVLKRIRKRRVYYPQLERSINLGTAHTTASNN